MAQHNLGTVVGFEFFRVVTKRRFWAAALAVPLGLAVVFALVFVSSSTTDRAARAQKDARLTFTYTDASGVVTDEVAAAFGGTRVTDGDRALADVRDGTLEAYFAYPADLTTQPVRAYGVDRGIFQNGTYAAVARQVLVAAAEQQIGSPELAGLARGDVTVTSEAYKDGEASGGPSTLVPPLLFLVAFYVSIILLGNQMLNSTLEEKENRVTEMILTSMDPTTLIVGKVVSLFLVGLVQLLTFAVPVAIGYVFFRKNLALPDVDLSHLVLEPVPMAVGFLLLVGGFVLFTGTLVAIGAVVPTAKEAGTYFAPLMILIFVPFYVVSLVVSDPTSLIVQVFTYFPYTAAVTALLRNAFGSLSLVASVVVVVELFALGYVALRVAVHLFRYGSIEYSKKLSVRAVLRRRRATVSARDVR